MLVASGFACLQSQTHSIAKFLSCWKAIMNSLYFSELELSTILRLYLRIFFGSVRPPNRKVLAACVFISCYWVSRVYHPILWSAASSSCRATTLTVRPAVLYLKSLTALMTTSPAFPSVKYLMPSVIITMAKIKKGGNIWVDQCTDTWFFWYYIYLVACSVLICQPKATVRSEQVWTKNKNSGL